VWTKSQVEATGYKVLFLSRRRSRVQVPSGPPTVRSQGSISMYATPDVAYELQIERATQAGRPHTSCVSGFAAARGGQRT
jgi:hypothetical protein